MARRQLSWTDEAVSVGSAEEARDRIIYLIQLLKEYESVIVSRPLAVSNSIFLCDRLEHLRKLRENLRGHLREKFAEVKELQEIIRLLEHQGINNFREIGVNILCLCARLESRGFRREPEYIHSERPIGSLYWRRVHNVLLVGGPGIGVGDEIIYFHLAHAIKRCLPFSRIHIISTYPGLWDRLKVVDSVLSYSKDPFLPDRVMRLKDKRNAPIFDVVISMDFLHSGFYQCYQNDRDVTSFVKMSLADHSLFWVDNRMGVVYTHRKPVNYLDNKYFGLTSTLYKLKLCQSPLSLGRPTLQTKKVPLRSRGNKVQFFINPFTSKEESRFSHQNWQDIIIHLLGLSRWFGPLKVVINSGVNNITLRFAKALRDSLLDLKGTSHILISGEDRRGFHWMSLEDNYRVTEDSDIILGQDTFTSHMAVAMGKVSLVIGDVSNKDWIPPFPEAMYFDKELDIEPLGDALCAVIILCLGKEKGGMQVSFTDGCLRSSQRIVWGTKTLHQNYQRLFKSISEKEKRQILMDCQRYFLGLLQDRRKFLECVPAVFHSLIQGEILWREKAFVWPKRGFYSDTIHHMEVLLADWYCTNTYKLAYWINYGTSTRPRKHYSLQGKL